MKICKIKDDELEADERKLVNGEITDPNKFKQIEKCTPHAYRTGVN